MQLVVRPNKNQINAQGNDFRYARRFRLQEYIVRPDRIKVGSYYLYEEKHGMSCLVKILEDTSQGDWIGFRLLVKRVLHSHWHVPKNCVFETGYHASLDSPSAWHLEPALELLQNKAV